MLEYKWDKHNTIGIGLQKGRTELSSNIYTENGTFVSSDVSGATINKWGLEYSRQFYVADYDGSNNGLNRVHFSLLAGAFWVRHRYNNYENDGKSPFTFLSKDSIGNTIDSATASSRLLVPNGFIVSLGFRVGLLSKVKKKEKLSVTFLYDHGFVTLWEKNHYYYHNYLNDFTIATMTSRGNQFKVYLSIPIRLYAIDNKKVTSR
jgi:ribosome biogenesis protein Nip4